MWRFSRKDRRANHHHHRETVRALNCKGEEDDPQRMESFEPFWISGLYLFPRNSPQVQSKLSKMRQSAARVMFLLTNLWPVIFVLLFMTSTLGFALSSGMLRFLSSHLTVTILCDHLFLKRNQLHELLSQISSTAARCPLDRGTLRKLSHQSIYLGYAMALAYVVLHQYDHWRNWDGWAKRLNRIMSFDLLDPDSYPTASRIYMILFEAFNHWTLAAPAFAICVMISSVCSVIARCIHSLNQDLERAAHHAENQLELYHLKESYESIVDCVTLAESCFSFTCLVLFSTLGITTCQDAVWMCLSHPQNMPIIDLISIFGWSKGLLHPPIGSRWVSMDSA